MPSTPIDYERLLGVELAADLEDLSRAHYGANLMTLIRHSHDTTNNRGVSEKFEQFKRERKSPL